MVDGNDYDDDDDDDGNNNGGYENNNHNNADKGVTQGCSILRGVTIRPTNLQANCRRTQMCRHTNIQAKCLRTQYDTKRNTLRNTWAQDRIPK